MNGKTNNGIFSVVLTILIACTVVHKNNAFTIINDRLVLSTTRIQNQQNGMSSSYPSTSKSTVLYAGEMPEPGPCPECSDANGYWDGSTNFVCIACGHEWLVADDSSQGDGDDDDGDDSDGDGVIRDSNGSVLESGDTVVLTKELGKGLKKGLKVTRIRVGDFGDDHDVQANIPGMGTFNLKSGFLKKTK